MLNTLKRKFKNLLSKNSSSNANSNAGSKLILVFTITCAITFLVTQLVINAILSPLGSKLESYNFEKGRLIDQNRELEEKIAETQSLTIIKKLTEKKLSLTPHGAKAVIYISDDTLHAQK